METTIKIHAENIETVMDLQDKIIAALGFEKNVNRWIENPKHNSYEWFSTKEPSLIEAPHDKLVLILEYDGNEEAIENVFYKLK